MSPSPRRRSGVVPGARTRRTAAVAACLVLAGAAAPAAPALARGAAGGAAAPVAGAAGIGDPYFPLDGNGGIDVLRYDVHDDYRFSTGRLTGWTRLTVDATQDLSSFDLDFLLPVTSVSVDGRRAGVRRPNAHELRITPFAPLGAGTRFQVRVTYAGSPRAVSWAGERNWLADDGEVVAMNEPHMAAWWFPANDHPRDRARMGIHITAPRDMQVVANGRLVSRTVHGRRATTSWSAAEPMAPYLAFFAAGHFVVRRGVHDGLPWYVAVSRGIPAATRAASLRLMRRTPGIVSWLETQLGRYPFSATGGLTTGLGPGFSLETQTRPTYPVLGSAAVTTVVHELAHQWFGDSVAVHAWRDIWLNEGAATFMEARWAETHGGQTAQAWLDSWYARLGAGEAFWSREIADPGPRHLFDWPVYLRGGMALQALRHRIGDDDFWPLLQRWVQENRNGTGTTVGFQALAESVSGEDLDSFFHDWLRAGTKPPRTPDNGLGSGRTGTGSSPRR